MSEINVDKAYAYTVDDIKIENIICQTITENNKQESEGNEDTQKSVWIKYKDEEGDKELKIYTPYMKGATVSHDKGKYKINLTLSKETEEEKKIYKIIEYIDKKVRNTDKEEQLDDIEINIPKEEDGVLKCGVIEVTKDKKKKLYRNPKINNLEEILHKDSTVQMVINVMQEEDKEASKLKIILDYIKINNSEKNTA